MRSLTIFSLLLVLILQASVVWSWPDFLDDIVKRADITPAPDSSATSATSASSASDNTASGATSTDSASDSSGTNTASGSSETGTNTASGTNSDTTASPTSSSTSTSISINPEWPEGGAAMTNPASTTTTFYRIGNNVTFGWNFTSVEVTPTAVDIVASCSSNSATYTLANNVSYANATSVVWNTDQYGSNAQSPLLTAHYTLIIYEAGTSPTQIASPGQLGPASYTFGMYIHQSYTPLSQYVCVTCNSATTGMDRQALGFMLSMVAITVFSFTAFAGGFRILF